MNDKRAIMTVEFLHHLQRMVKTPAGGAAQARDPMPNVVECLDRQLPELDSLERQLVLREVASCGYGTGIDDEDIQGKVWTVLERGETLARLIDADGSQMRGSLSSARRLRRFWPDMFQERRRRRIHPCEGNAAGGAI